MFGMFRRRGRRKENNGRSRQEFRTRYANFKALLDSNSHLLSLMGDIEDKLRGDKVFGMSFIRSTATSSLFHAMRMVKSLNAVSGGGYAELEEAVERIRSRISDCIGLSPPAPPKELILPHEEITKEMVDWVGGKNANLGEIRSKANIPVPPGFAVTIAGHEAVVVESGIADELDRLKMEIDPEDTGSIVRASERLEHLILTSEVPKALEQALLDAQKSVAEAAGQGPDELLLALRSSAIGEDSELSFAGQYLTVLGVPRHKIVSDYKLILASLFTPRAISYRLQKGVPIEGIAMSVACLAMVRARASGVLYSRHPFDVMDDSVLINAVWGLGPYAVDGEIEPDVYVVKREDPGRIHHSRIAHKPVGLQLRPNGYVGQFNVEPQKMRSPCLNQEQAALLARYALKLEEHFGVPQDMEWALDEQGKLFILQARPLRVEDAAKTRKPEIPSVAGERILLEGGDSACPGIGFGPVRVVRSDADLTDFPRGAVLVAEHSSPKYALVLQRAQAVVTDYGSVTGHMASLAREYGVPAVLNAKTAASELQDGQIVTVDAYSCRIYAGRVEKLVELAKAHEKPRLMQGTPVYEALRKMAALITPLNLVDPASSDFGPRGVKTLHDVTRLVHEFSYKEMFKISDLAYEHAGMALKLDAPLPVDLYVIDLGGGLSEQAAGRASIRPEHVTSKPLRALIAGLSCEALRSTEPRPVNLGGFFSVLTEQMLSSPYAAGERFGDKSYALISDAYLNFSSRVGYHYSILDAYVSKTINLNYVHFEFKGGAADDVRKNRRVRAIALILQRLGFTVEVKADRVKAEFQKYEEPDTQRRIEEVGKLLIFTRQADMLMDSEQMVEEFARAFLEGDYLLEQVRGNSG